MNVTIEQRKSKDGYRWRAIADNGEIVAESGEAYSRKTDLRRALKGLAGAVLRILTCVMLVLVGAGCANLGNGMVDIPGVGAIPIENIAGAMDAGAPGSGDILRGGEAQLQAALGRTPPGPFGSLPYTVERQVVLKSGVVIKQDEIEKILEILTPTTPNPIIRVVAPEDFLTVPVATNAP